MLSIVTPLNTHCTSLLKLCTTMQEIETRKRNKLALDMNSEFLNILESVLS